VEGARALLDRIAAYGVAYHLWIAPKGWTGSAAVGADGSTVVTLYPVGGRNRATVSRSKRRGLCGLCASRGGRLFSKREVELKKVFDTAETVQTLPHGTQLIPVSSSLKMYLQPDKDDLLGRGAVYYQPPNEYVFAKAEFVLPRTDAELSKFLVRTLVAQQEWR
jgi:hypothetical protein